MSCAIWSKMMVPPKKAVVKSRLALYNLPVSEVDVRIDCIDLLVHRDVIHPRDAH